MGDLLKEGTAMGGRHGDQRGERYGKPQISRLPRFCHLAAIDMLRFNGDLQLLEPLEEITPHWRG